MKCIDCGRETEKKCRYCSECGYITRQLSHDIARHNYLNSDHGKKKNDEYFKSDRHKELRKKYINTDERRAYKRELYKKSKEVKI